VDIRSRSLMTWDARTYPALATANNTASASVTVR